MWEVRPRNAVIPGCFGDQWLTLPAVLSKSRNHKRTAPFSYIKTNASTRQKPINIDKAGGYLQIALQTRS